MEGLKMIPYLALIICISGVIIGAGAIMLGKFGGTVEVCYNSSFTLNAAETGCYNTTPAPAAGIGKNGLNITDQYYTLSTSKQGVSTIAEQQPTVAIIAVMVIIISVIAGVFVYMRMFA